MGRVPALVTTGCHPGWALVTQDPSGVGAGGFFLSYPWTGGEGAGHGMGVSWRLPEAHLVQDEGLPPTLWDQSPVPRLFPWYRDV